MACSTSLTLHTLLAPVSMLRSVMTAYHVVSLMMLQTHLLGALPLPVKARGAPDPLAPTSSPLFYGLDKITFRGPGTQASYAPAIHRTCTFIYGWNKINAWV